MGLWGRSLAPFRCYQTPVCHVRVIGSASQLCFYLQLPARTHPGRQQTMAQVQVPCQPWERPRLNSGLVQPGLLQVFGDEASSWKICFSFSLLRCLSNKIGKREKKRRVCEAIVRWGTAHSRYLIKAYQAYKVERQRKENEPKC